MGLKNIHVLFISMAIVLCLAFGTWCVTMYRDQQGTGYLAVGVGSFVCAVGLVVYGNWFLRKMKGIDSR
jgi:hypothetical protein